jgi:hypothetical protein
MTIDRRQIDDAINQHSSWIVQQQGVAGCDNSFDQAGRPCLRVFTDKIADETKRAIVARVTPVPVCFEESGPISAQSW